jgi:tRNA A-37 threonylcarbamoyl transferase component Bud32
MLSDMSKAKIEVIDKGGLEVNRAFLPLLESNGLATFKALMSHPGHAVAKCAIKERNTVRLDLETETGEKRAFFLKRYTLPKIRERLKTYLSLKRPAPGAGQEWHAMWTFMQRGLTGPVPVAWGQDGKNSLVLSEGVSHVMKLSEWAERYLGEGSGINPQVLSSKRKIIEEVANIVARMHIEGLYHQDLYLCHFLCGSEQNGIPLTLIDLQRVKQHRMLPRKWQVKDLAQLHFSSAQYLTRRDIRRFWKVYDSIYHTGRRKIPLWHSILRKSKRIRRHTLKHGL